MDKVIIFGNSGYNTLGTMHCFKNKGISFFLLLVEKNRLNSAIFSNAVSEYKIVHNEAQGVSFLIDKKDIWKNATIIPTSDNAVNILNKNFSSLSDYNFPHSLGNSFELLLDKKIQTKIANESGITVPLTFEYRKGEKLPNNIIYPCIVKPQNSTTGKKFVMNECYTEKELLNAIHSVNHTNDFLIQQYVNKEYELLLIGCRFKNDQVWIPGIFKKERWYQKGNDGSYGIISTDVKKFYPNLDRIDDFLKKLNYYGPFSIEFGVVDNMPFFYEINMRNDGTSHYFHKAGIYIPYIYWLSNNIELETIDLNIERREYRFIDELGDFINIGANLSIKKWISELKTAMAYKYYDKSDLKPFLFLAPRRIIATIYKKIR